MATVFSIPHSCIPVMPTRLDAKLSSVRENNVVFEVFSRHRQHVRHRHDDDDFHHHRHAVAFIDRPLSPLLLYSTNDATFFCN